VNLDEYLKTTQLFHNIESSNKKWRQLSLWWLQIYFYLFHN
jgi:hypothetical protein